MSLAPVISRNANDTYVYEAAPSRNFAGVTYLETKAGAGTQFLSYIYFSRPFPLGATILSATLRLYQITAETVSQTVTLRRITSLSWQLSTTTWNVKPAATTTGQVAVTKAASPLGTEWAFDVTAHMQLVSDGTPWAGWQISSASTTDSMYFGSSQHPTLKPVLEVVWSDAPDAPSTLAPSGNRAVSVAKPVLRFDYTDVSGSTSLQAVQVQINATNVWTAPTFDSGTVLTSDPQLDLATTAYAGLAEGASTFWRVRVRDGAGLWSDWSFGAQFQKQAKGTLTITNPPISGLISEPTPPIIWTFTGRTQTAWQVFVTPVNDVSKVLHNTGKVSGTTTSYTLPPGILRDDQTYYAHVRVWDTISRESTPNDTSWTYAPRTFTYEYDLTVNPVTSLAVIDQAPVPAAQLTWSRATAPDSFVIRRNNVIIASGLLPVDLSTGGTNYAYTDRGAPVNQSVTWSVQAVVNARTSASNPSVTGNLKTTGIWLQDASRNIAVQLRGSDPGNWTMGEQSAIYSPVGGSRSIVITQALRGSEGSMSGRIAASKTATLAQQEAALYALKSTPGRIYTLTLSNVTIPVVIGNLVIAPTDDLGVKAVSFEFWQQGDLPFVATL